MSRLLTNSCVWIAAFGLTCTANAASAPVATPLGAHREFLHSPARVATDDAGNIFVTEPELGQVIRFDAFGRAAIVKERLVTPLAIAVSPFGNIYVGEEKSGSVSVFDPEWNLLAKLGAGDGEFALPNFMAVYAALGSDVVYVSDSLANQIKVFTNGLPAFVFGNLGTNVGQFDFPAGIHVGASGEVFVVDQNNNRIQVFDLNGGFLRQFSAITTSGSVLGGIAGGRCQGIAGDLSNRVYVADALQALVNVFDGHGALLMKLGGFGEAKGKLLCPGGLAIAPANQLVISSVNTHRLEIFGLDSFVHLSVMPARSVVSVGTDVTFSALADGSAPYAFQWRKDGADLTDGGGISGATNAMLNLNSVSSNNAGSYSVAVSWSSGSFTSFPALLTVLEPPSFVTQPASQVVAQGSNVTFSLTAAGDLLGYQWRFKGADIAGATKSSLEISNAQPWHSGNYTVLVSNVVGQAMSAEAVLTVLQPPAIAVPASGGAVFFGSDYSFQVTATGDALSFQWLFNDIPIAGATTDTLMLTSASLTNAGKYSVIISNFTGSITSSVASLTINTSPHIRSLSSHQTLPFGGTAVLNVFATGLTPLTYQWQFNGVDAPGTDSSELVITNAAPEHVGLYAVRISNISGMTTSSPVALSLFGITSVGLPPDGSVQLKLAGIPGAVYRVECKTNLDAHDWTSLSNFIQPVGALEFADPDPKPAPQSFYRAQIVP